jgi:DNA helicase TIP49 (TBP-interacting protein)
VAGKTEKAAPMHFKTVIHADVPRGRNGKHKEIVTVILRDLDKLKQGAALKVPIAELPDTKENIRSALNRATRKAGQRVATAADDQFLYIWNVATL